MPDQPKSTRSFNPRVALASIVVVSAALTANTIREEGIRYVPYYDTVGVRTVCVGSTNRVESRRYSPAECNARLATDLRSHASGALACIKVPMAQTEFEAFADLAFNVGVPRFCASTLVLKLNAGDYEGACKEILRWVKQPELKARRQRAYALCMTPVDIIKEEPNVVLKVTTELEDRGPLVLKPARSFWSWFLGRS